MSAEQGMPEPLPEGWQQVLDARSGRFYYCNLEKNVTQWTIPTEGTSVPGESQPQHETSTNPIADSHVEDDGWFYSDAFGTRQGPFTQEQLKEWRPFLPMNMIVTYMSSSSGPGEDGDELSTELAELIGDGALFASWQKHPANKEGAVAPPAPVWEHWLESRKAMAVAAAAASNAASTSSTGRPESFNSYADAVIAGLSPHDEAVQLSHLAAASGQTLQDLLNFNYAASTSAAARAGGPGDGGGGGDPDQEPLDPREAPPPELPPVEGEDPVEYSKYDTEAGEYSFSADYCPRQRRLVVKEREQGGPTALYGELMRWCDPVELERSLQEAAKRKGKPVPPAVWKKLKERKLQMKKKTSWLLQP